MLIEYNAVAQRTFYLLTAVKIVYEFFFVKYIKNEVFGDDKKGVATPVIFIVS